MCLFALLKRIELIHFVFLTIYSRFLMPKREFPTHILALLLTLVATIMVLSQM